MRLTSNRTHGKAAKTAVSVVLVASLAFSGTVTAFGAEAENLRGGGGFLSL